MNRDLTEVYDLLYRLGVTANYTGFFQTSYAVLLCAEQPERLLFVTKWLYPEVAKRYRTKWTVVERNIRTVGDIIWRKNRPLLEHLAHGSLAQKPRNAHLLAILAASLDDFPPVHKLGEAAALPGETDDVRLMNEPINKDSDKTAAAKDSVSPRERQATRNDKAPAAAVV